MKNHKILKTIIIILIVAGIITGTFSGLNYFFNRSNYSFIEKSIKNVEYESQLQPTVDSEGNFQFVCDRDFRIMHLTDIHIGGGAVSAKKDNKALNAVASLITSEKPDLVVVTGDIAFPVPYASGTLNNKTPALIFASLMEKLGVYWCLAYGNHDTEAYSFYNREKISDIYENREKYPHCLFQRGPDSIDGCGNYVINIKNSSGKITQSLFMLDSHSYTDKDYFGIMWKYDCVHKNQIEWYENEVGALSRINGGTVPPSLMFMHIPIKEMRKAYYEYRDNGFKDTDSVKYITGEMGEKDIVVYSSEYNYGLFDSCYKLGSTKAIFFGHDHLNNMSLNYKGIDLCYGYSIDYLAYKDIDTYGSQRGCSMITVSPDGKYKTNKENFYQDKYITVNTKEDVTMDSYYTDED